MRYKFQKIFSNLDRCISFSIEIFPSPPPLYLQHQLFNGNEGAVPRLWRGDRRGHRVLRHRQSFHQNNNVRALGDCNESSSFAPPHPYQHWARAVSLTSRLRTLLPICMCSVVNSLGVPVPTERAIKKVPRYEVRCRHSFVHQCHLCRLTRSHILAYILDRCTRGLNLQIWIQPVTPHTLTV